MPYDAYLQTSWWRWRRDQAIKRAGYRCERCGDKRNLQVHHVSYANLGNEADEDFQVLCRGCHLGHHVAEATPNRSVYLAIISAALKAEHFETVPDLVEEVKRRCAQLKIPYEQGQVQAAVARLDDERLGIRARPIKHAELLHAGEGHRPMTRAEAAGWMAKLQAVAKPIPEAHLPTLREAEHRKALRIVLQAIAMQSARCDEVEAAS